MLPHDAPCAWAIRPNWLPALANGFPPMPGGEARKLLEADRPPTPLAGGTAREVRGVRVQQFGAVAVLPLNGIVSQRPNWLSKYRFGTSAEQFAAAHEELVADPSVAAVVWDVDSPGGSVAGVPEAADRLFALRGRKRVAAVSNSLMASAAYWLASAAGEVIAAPSSLTGSIGVYQVHIDRSGANDKAGVTVTYAYAGPRKIDGNPDFPLTDPARESIQRTVDDYYGQFAAAVARHRRTTQAAVRDGYGQGDVLTARRAVAAGLADRIDTLAAVVARLGGAGARPNPAVALLAARQRHALSLT